MTPIRASIVGPLGDTSIRTSIAVCHSGRSDSFFGRLVMSAASRNVMSFRESKAKEMLGMTYQERWAQVNR